MRTCGFGTTPICLATSITVKRSHFMPPPTKPASHSTWQKSWLNTIFITYLVACLQVFNWHGMSLLFWTRQFHLATYVNLPSACLDHSSAWHDLLGNGVVGSGKRLAGRPMWPRYVYRIRLPHQRIITELKWLSLVFAYTYIYTVYIYMRQYNWQLPKCPVQLNWMNQAL